MLDLAFHISMQDYGMAAFTFTSVCYLLFMLARCPPRATVLQHQRYTILARAASRLCLPIGHLMIALFTHEAAVPQTTASFYLHTDGVRRLKSVHLVILNRDTLAYKVRR